MKYVGVTGNGTTTTTYVVPAIQQIHLFSVLTAVLSNVLYSLECDCWFVVFGFLLFLGSDLPLALDQPRNIDILSQYVPPRLPTVM